MENATLTDAWTDICDNIAERIGQQRFSLWFRDTEPVKLEPGSVTIGVPNVFVREWLEQH